MLRTHGVAARPPLRLRLPRPGRSAAQDLRASGTSMPGTPASAVPRDSPGYEGAPTAAIRAAGLGLRSTLTVTGRSCPRPISHTGPPGTSGGLDEVDDEFRFCGNAGAQPPIRRSHAPRRAQSQEDASPPTSIPPVGPRKEMLVWRMQSETDQVIGVFDDDGTTISACWELRGDDGRRRLWLEITLTQS
jgi:hypothetical protein